MMQIPQQYPQFAGSAALLIVASRQNAVFYSVAQSKLEKIDELHIENPHYSDREGQFRSSGHGMVSRTGAPLEDISDQGRQEFLLKFEDKAKEVIDREAINAIYLFVPKQMRELVKARLPERYLSLVEQVFEGNFVKSKPIKLIAKIDDHLRSKTTNKIVTPEVARILSLGHPNIN